jgi:3-dehydroquinate dehydratase-2
MQPRILIINGPGPGDLGGCDGDGHKGLTLELLRQACRQLCDDLRVDMDFRQADGQEEMIQWIAEDSENFDGLIISPADCSPASTDVPSFYQSVLRDAASLEIPVIEVHTNNIYRNSESKAHPLREPKGEMGFICGFGMHSYLMAIKAIAKRLSGNS